MALRFFKVLILIFWLLVPAFSIWPQYITSEVAETYDEPEAGAWLAHQASISAPEAKNKERLKRLVDWLYKDGAVFVGAVLAAGEDSGSGDLRGLRVYLPIDKAARAQIFRVANRELVKSGYRSEDDTGRDTLTIWF